MSNEYGEYIRKVRKEKGLSLKKIAQELGFSVSYVSDVELGKRNPFDAEKNRIVSRVLAIPFEVLSFLSADDKGFCTLDIHNRPKKEKNLAMKLMLFWEKLSDDDFILLYETIKKIEHNHGIRRQN